MKRLKMKPLTLRLVAIILLVISVGWLIVSYDQWNGARAWESQKAEILQQGYTLDPDDLATEAPAPAANFAAHPLIASLIHFGEEEGTLEIVYEDPQRHEQFIAMRLPDKEIKDATIKSETWNVYPSWMQAKPADLGALVGALRASGDFNIPDDAQTDAEAILAALFKFETELAELDLAATRPLAMTGREIPRHFPDSTLFQIPYLSELLSHGRLQCVRCIAALEAGDHETARASLQVLLQLGRTAGSDNVLIGHMVRCTINVFLINAIYHGHHGKLWNAEDLKWIAKTLEAESTDLLAQFRLCSNGELIMLLGAVEFLRNGRGDDPGVGMLYEQLTDSGTFQTVLVGRIGRIAPGLLKGTFDHNRAALAESFLSQIHPVLEKQSAAYLPDKSEPSPGRVSLKNFVAYNFEGTLPTAAERSFRVMTALDLACLASAIEGYALSHGTYPKSLDELVPDYLKQIPKDWYSPEREPLQYRRDAKRYRIYSVGSNHTDEGGAVVPASESHLYPSPRFKPDFDQGDLVWGYDLSSEKPQ